jgi:hypothetical protein
MGMYKGASMMRGPQMSGPRIQYGAGQNRVKPSVGNGKSLGSKGLSMNSQQKISRHMSKSKGKKS